LSLPFDRKYVHCVRSEDEGEAKREIIKQISSSSGAVKKNKKTEAESHWPVVIKNQSPNQAENEHKFVISCLHSALALINSMHQPSASLFKAFTLDLEMKKAPIDSALIAFALFLFSPFY
jgi:hypothetical protein